MDAEDGGTTVRRSSRKRKEISYQVIEDGESPTSATPQSAEEPAEEPDDAFVDDALEAVPLRRGRKRRPVDGDHVPSVKKEGIGAKTWDDRIYALAGSDPAARAAMVEKADNWRDVLVNIPDELLDYTIGWGVCKENWGRGGDEQQKVEFIEAKDGQTIFAVEQSLNLTMGPRKSLQNVTLEPLQSVSIATYFPKKKGHVINIGQPIWGLDFLPEPPSTSKSRTQYLAIAGHPTLQTRPKLYTPESGPNVIHIWAVEHHTPKSDGKTYPVTTIYHNWGCCWGLKFSPYGASGNGRVGILAGVFGDGAVHVLDIRDNWIGNAKKKVNIRVVQPAWEHSLGETALATCVSWKSHNELIIGYSHGFVAIFNIEDSTDDRNIPTFFHSVSDTYIVCVASLAPMYPHFLVAGSFDGIVQAIDIRSPEIDNAVATRQRGIPSLHKMLNLGFVSTLTSIEAYGGILSAEDLCSIRYCSFRPLKRGTIVVAHEGGVWDVASSQGARGAGVHALILSGGCDGACCVASPTNRLFGGSKRSSRKILFRMQKVEDGFKMLEEFAVEIQELQNLTNTKVFPSELAVTKVVWCMNAGNSGLYAAGTGCGLVRIEDINA